MSEKEKMLNHKRRKIVWWKEMESEGKEDSKAK